jgi:hypothetical protein
MRFYLGHLRPRGAALAFSQSICRFLRTEARSRAPPTFTPIHMVGTVVVAEGSHLQLSRSLLRIPKQQAKGTRRAKIGVEVCSCKHWSCLTRSTCLIQSFGKKSCAIAIRVERRSHLIWWQPQPIERGAIKMEGPLHHRCGGRLGPLPWTGGLGI